MNSTSSISTLVVAVLKSATTFGLLIAITAGCSWDERPVKKIAGNAASGVNGNSGAASGASSAAQPGTQNVRNPAIAEGTPSFRFGNIDYVLVSSSDIVNQYIPFGQTLQNWTSMFALRKFPNMADPDEAVSNVTQKLKVDHPETRFKVTRDPNTGDQGVDFLIWSQDKQETEFDVHIYQRRNGGVIGKMFFMKGYGDTGHVDLLKKVADEKDSLTKAVFRFRFPTFIQP